MSNIRELRAQRGALIDEMRRIQATHPDGVLPAEIEARWTDLRGKVEAVDAALDRQAFIDEADRQAPAQPVGPAQEARAEPSLFLAPEQRMADLHCAERRDEPVPSAGRVIADRLAGREETRAYGSTPDTAGGYFLNENVSASFLDRVRNATRVIQAGAQTMPLPAGGVRLVRVDSDPTPSWRAEGATIPVTTGSLGAILIQPQSLAARVAITNELLDDAPNAGEMIDNSLAQALALEVDRAALYGTGSGNMPLGLRGMAGVNEQIMGTSDGATPTSYDDVLDLLLKVREANFEPTTIIAAPRSYTKWAKLVTGIASDRTKLVPPAEWTALQRLSTNQVSITETQGSSVGIASTAFVGGFEHMVFAVRQAVQIEASRVSDDSFARNMTQIRATLRMDIAVLRPAAFGRLIGLL